MLVAREVEVRAGARLLLSPVSFQVSARLFFIVCAAVRVLYEFWREKVLDVFI